LKRIAQYRQTLIREFGRAADLIEKSPKPLLLAIGYLSAIVIEILNFMAGHEIRLAVFYFPSLFLLTWFVSTRSAAVLAILSSVFWFMIGFDLLEITSMEHIWNALMRFVLFVTFVYVVRAYKRERNFARQDFLTKVANGQRFTELSNIEIERCRRYGRPFSVAYMDIDDFKKINDSFGHIAGDDLLFKVARTIRGNIRSTDTVARLGGDEFAILLPETGFEPACRLVQKIRVLLLDAVQDRFWQCTFSFGVVTFLSAPPSVDDMIRQADALMYKAKAAGKNQAMCIKYEI